MKQNRRFLRLIKEAKGNWAKREDKEFMNFPFSCSLIPRGMVKCRCMRKALCARSRQQQTRKDEDHMKKFLSLLLALTLVLSLVVVPARAHDGTIAGDFSVTASASSVGKGDNVIFSASASSATVDGKAATVSGYKWKLGSGEVISGQTGATYTVALSEATTATCIFTLSYKSEEQNRQKEQPTNKGNGNQKSLGHLKGAKTIAR